ncbi:MAG: cation transporter [Terriglobia bacterium]
MANAKVYFKMRIEGMTCDGCARHVTKALQGVSGVQEAQVGSWKAGHAVTVADETVDEGNGSGGGGSRLPRHRA